MSLTLKAARVNAGLTQFAAAKALNIGKSTLAGYESYERSPTIEKAQEIANLYGLTTNDIKWSKE